MKVPNISSNPHENDVERNKRYLHKAEAERERIQKEQIEADEAYKVFQQGDTRTQAKPLYKQQSKVSQQKQLRSQARSSSQRHERVKKVRSTNKSSAILAHASWSVALLELCCCQTNMLIAAISLLFGLAAVYLSNKGKHSAANSIAVLVLIVGVGNILGNGLNASQVASQFFTLH